MAGLLLTIRSVDISGEPGRIIIATGDQAAIAAAFAALEAKVRPASARRPLRRRERTARSDTTPEIFRR